MFDDFLLEVGRVNNSNFWVQFGNITDLPKYGEIYDMLIRIKKIDKSDILIIIYISFDKQHTFLIFSEYNSMHYKTDNIIQDFLYCWTLYRNYNNIILGPDYSEITQTTYINEDIIKKVILDMKIINFQYYALIN
jgi:hypothetical protein